MTMLDDIIFAMNKLGGHCYYKDLYEALRELNPNILESTVRATIERNSKDSKAFAKDHIFYSVEGLGRGHWGLVNPDINAFNMDYTSDDEGFKEGKKILRQHLSRERNHFLKTRAIQEFKNKNSDKVYCELCGFDFYSKYGDIGKDFIEIHHTKPICEMDENERTKLEDVILLCSNCHSMIHRKRPWLKKEDILKLIK